MRYYLEADYFINSKTTLVLDSKRTETEDFVLDEQFAIENNFRKFHLCFFTLQKINDVFDNLFCVSLCHTLNNNSFFLSINQNCEVNSIGENRFYKKLKKSYIDFDLANHEQAYVIEKIFDFLIGKSIDFTREEFIFMGL